MPRKLILMLALLATFALCGCDDDENETTCPPGSTPDPTLANIWPHADGTRWLYDLRYTTFAGPPLSPTPPPASTLEELHAALQVPPAGAPVDTSDGFYQLKFEGDVTTESGVTAQNLTGVIYDAIGPVARAVGGERRLLAAVVALRPEYREAIRARFGGDLPDEKSLADAWQPFFLGSYAFAYEDSGYFGYGDIDTTHSWAYLAEDLTVGREFSLQLLGWLGDPEIWLRGRIWSVGDRVIDGVAWENVVECMYQVDFGTVTATDEQGEVLGYFRADWYGTTMFVPGVGPVACDERHTFAPSSALVDVPYGLDEYRCRLVGSTRP